MFIHPHDNKVTHSHPPKQGGKTFMLAWGFSIWDLWSLDPRFVGWLLFLNFTTVLNNVEIN